MKYTEKDIIQAVKQSKSIAQVCRLLNLKPAGGNYKTLKIKFKELNIDTSHFTGQGWNIGLNFKPNPPQPLNEILIKNSKYINSNSLRKQLINEEVLLAKCNICGIDEWNSKPLSLELNHKNGDNLDHRLNNLEILCPNCHSQTSNYRGRNIGRSLRN